MNRLVILDRDGVINHDSDNYIKSASEWLPIDGSIDAIAQLSRAGYRVVVASNQSGLARGLFQQTDLDAMHEKLLSLVANAGGKIAGIFYCPHHPDENCRCRKPKTGLIDDIENAFSTTAAGCFFIGDSIKDLQAGSAKHCHAILVKTGKGQESLRHLQNQPIDNVQVFDNLAAAATFIIKQ